MMVPRLRRMGVILTMLAASISGCRGEARPPIGDSLFVEILTGLHIADAHVTTGIHEGGVARDSVFRVHGVSEERFQSTLEYYSDDAGAYLELYDRVISRLNELQQETRTSGSSPTDQSSQ